VHGTSVLKAVEVANTRSQNLYAELLLRRLGQMRGAAGTYEGGADVVRQVFEFDAEGSFRQADGSGLSRANQASADDVGRILLRLFASQERLHFMGSLPKGGDAEGTLRKRFKEKRFDGRVLAKTGTLRDTSSLAGYVRAEDGRVLAFAILCEGELGVYRALQDAVVAALVGP
jgi:D-alanyl-D-alanine carboxypeptidase/D-alanyl-D-alanine-endopeptidase (penicillin-binding protein 4)